LLLTDDPAIYQYIITAIPKIQRTLIVPESGNWIFHAECRQQTEGVGGGTGTKRDVERTA
jgi:hypothetical protein